MYFFAGALKMRNQLHPFFESLKDEVANERSLGISYVDSFDL